MIVDGAAYENGIGRPAGYYGMPIHLNSNTTGLPVGAGTPVSPFDILSAKHIYQLAAAQLAPGNLLRGSDGIDREIIENILHPDKDLWLIRVNSPLPGYHPIGYATNIGAEVTVHGYGRKRTTPTGTGWNVGSTDGVDRWGYNYISSLSPDFAIIRFIEGDTVAIGVENDSGGGIFQGFNGMTLLGVAFSASDRLGPVVYNSSTTTYTRVDVPWVWANMTSPQKVWREFFE